MTGYPIILDLAGKRCLLVGGGHMAEEKAAGLVGSGAAVTFQAPELSGHLREFVDKGQVSWLRRHYRAGDLSGYFLVVVADEDRSRNAAIFAEAESAGIVVNCLDDPPHCRFIYPSVHRQGDLIISISTSGRCPALAVRARQQFEKQFGPEYAEFLGMMADVRKKLNGLVPEFSERKRIWYELVDSAAICLLHEGKRAEAEELIDRIVLEGAAHQS